jgi:hypothetical protein
VLLQQKLTTFLIWKKIGKKKTWVQLLMSSWKLNSVLTDLNFQALWRWRQKCLPNFYSGKSTNRQIACIAGLGQEGIILQIGECHLYWQTVSSVPTWNIFTNPFGHVPTTPTEDGKISQEIEWGPGCSGSGDYQAKLISLDAPNSYDVCCWSPQLQPQQVLFVWSYCELIVVRWSMQTYYSMMSI